MSIGNLKDEGNKGSNYPWQRGVLKLLGMASSAGLALESTQLQVLSAIQNEKDFGIQLVRDTGNADQIVMLLTIRNEDTGAITQTYLDAAGAPYTLVGPAEFVVVPDYTTDTGVIDSLTQRVTVSTDDNLVTNSFDIAAYTNQTWEALGKALTTVADDGDLSTADTDAEALALSPMANAAGAAAVKYSQAFLLRWLTFLLQKMRTTQFPATLTGSGNLKVAVEEGLPAGTNLIGAAGTYETPDATSTYCPSQDVSTAYEASSVSKASAGVFYGLSGYNSSGATQFIIVGNYPSVPGDGAVSPIAVILVPAQSPFSFDTGKFGIYCSAGISWWNSTAATPFTKTLGAADCFVNLSFK